MGALGLTLSLAPARDAGAPGFRRAGIPLDRADGVAAQSELTRHSARDIAEAGRELGRFDSRPWLGSVDVPAAVVITTRDEAVSPRKQRELAEARRARRCSRRRSTTSRSTAAASDYNPALLRGARGRRRDAASRKAAQPCR